MRIDGWEKELDNYLANLQPFEWGTNDCCQFTLGHWCDLCTGVNHFSKYKYSNEIGALKILKKHKGVDGLATLHLGESKQPLMAQRGDIVLFDGEQGHTLGICIGAKIAAVGPLGLVIVSMNKALKAWSV
jgi:hypothetical protein